ncbi:hypothetical protein [Mucilaginibacter sp. NFR10]|uniref:hypothetical protein n=1 Tax=Mucilaginibacter sp. NFR10 TaxID=1566292 RepID=UPI0008716102|nr:hypothetical protein [Mucilaginibacter sp. NFR10]SCW44540.1 hypothetical protein SAMN03159284_00809 [Mucilaginibacter sp. NFR10]
MPLNAVDTNGIGYPLVVNAWTASGGKLSANLYESVNNGNYPIDYPLPIVNEVEAFADYQIFIFKNRFGSKEDQYFRIQVDDKRSGIIFPIKVYSDSSNLPTVVDDEFLYRFLYIAFYNLLHEVNVISNNVDLDELNNLDRGLKIEDFYDDETVVLIYFNPGVHFDVVQVLPSLFKYGYVSISKKSDYRNIEILVLPVSDTPFAAFATSSWLKLYNVKSNLMAEPFVRQLFESTLKLALTPLVRFILLYQIVELLINRVGLEYYTNRNPNDADLATLLTANVSLTIFRDLLTNVDVIKNKMNDAVLKSEEARMRELFDNRCGLTKSDHPNIEVTAIGLISTLTGTSITDFLYPIRNKIVHSYHHLSTTHPNIDNLLAVYNRQFEFLMADTVTAFS